MTNRHENILGTIGNTPVVKLNKIGPKDVNLYVKIESFNPGGSVKDRLALSVIERAEETGELKPGRLSSRRPAAIPVSAWPSFAPRKATPWWSRWRKAFR